MKRKVHHFREPFFCGSQLEPQKSRYKIVDLVLSYTVTRVSTETSYKIYECMYSYYAAVLRKLPQTDQKVSRQLYTRVHHSNGHID